MARKEKVSKVIRLVEGPELSVRQTLRELQVPRATCRLTRPFARKYLLETAGNSLTSADDVHWCMRC